MGAITNFHTCNVIPKSSGLYQEEMRTPTRLDREWKDVKAVTEVWLFDPISHKHCCVLLPYVIGTRAVSGAANANRLHLVSQGLHPGENIDGKLLTSV